METIRFKIKDARGQVCFYMQIHRYDLIEKIQFVELKSDNYLTFSNDFFELHETNENMMTKLLSKIGLNELMGLKYSYEEYNLTSEEKNKIKNELELIRKKLMGK